MSLKKTIWTLLLLFPLFAMAQQKISVEDPDLEFSLEIPADWNKTDDGFYLLMYPAEDSGAAVLSLTYHEVRINTLDQSFDAAINGSYPANVPEFKLLETGKAKIGEAPARWAIYDSSEKGKKLRTITYFFIQNGQIFTVEGGADREVFENYENKFREIIHSVRSEKI